MAAAGRATPNTGTAVATTRVTTTTATRRIRTIIATSCYRSCVRIYPSKALSQTEIDISSAIG
jgi:hypothetical protein